MSQTKTPIHRVLRRLHEPVVEEDGVRSAADCDRIELHRKKPVAYTLAYLVLRSEGVFISEDTVSKAVGAGNQAPTQKEIDKDMRKLENREKVWRFHPADTAKRIGGFGIWRSDQVEVAKNLPGELKDDLTMAQFVVNGNDIVLPSLTPEAAQAVRDVPPPDLAEAEAYLLYYAELEVVAAPEKTEEQQRQTYAA